MNLETLHADERAQLVLGLLFGIAFGFLLQKGGVTTYAVIMGQLLLTDFTVFRIMASAVATGLIGFHLLKHAGIVRSHVRDASLGSNVIGGLIFGLGFGLLGYCPGTVAGAVGQGSLDALFGGVIGLLIGTGIFAELYPSLNRSILSWKPVEKKTVPELLGLPEWIVVAGGVVLIVLILLLLDMFGL
jgi:hypothetical protein